MVSITGRKPRRMTRDRTNRCWAQRFAPGVAIRLRQTRPRREKYPSDFKNLCRDRGNPLPASKIFCRSVLPLGSERKFRSTGVVYICFLTTADISNSF